MNNVDISEILECIKGHENNTLSFLVGAGISYNSGLPIVTDFLSYTLDKLNIRARDKDLLAREGLVYPFEMFMEIFLENTTDDTILDCFDGKEINKNHVLISRLVEIGNVNKIYTTNFDCLIEKSLRKKGIEKGTGYVRYFRESDFTGRNLESISDLVKLFKIHGSYHDKDSIRTTLSDVASDIQSSSRERVVHDIFKSGQHKSVLLMGYSCSDNFDVNPIIKSIKGSSKTIYHIDHTGSITEKENCVIKKISKGPLADVFDNYNGYSIKVNTDSFTNWLLSEISTRVEIKSNFTNDWRGNVDKWIKNFGTDHYKYNILGQLFYRVPDYPRARSYYEKAIVVDKSNNDLAKKARVVNNIGLTYQETENYDKAVQYFRRALSDFCEYSNDKDVALALSNLGLSYAHINPTKCIKYCRRAIALSRTNALSHIEANAFHNVGLCLKKKGKDADAVRFFKKALSIDRETGDKVGQLKTLRHIADIYRKNGKTGKAKKYYNESLQMSSKSGYLRGKVKALQEIANIYKENGRMNKYAEIQSRASEIKMKYDLN